MPSCSASPSGFGLLAKQAMVYAFLCIGCHAVVSQEARNALKGGRGVVAAAIALALFAPNVIWNAENGFPTVRHTEANIGWQYPYIHPLRLLDYIAVQFGVFGPILVVVLLRTAWREIQRAVRSEQGAAAVVLAAGAGASRGPGHPVPRPRQLDRDRLSRRLDPRHRRHARAQPADPVQDLARLCILPSRPYWRRHRPSRTRWPLFERLEFLSRVVGWHDAADVVRTKLAEQHYGSILVDTREMAGELLYYLRDVPTPLYVWPSGPTPRTITR